MKTKVLITRLNDGKIHSGQSLATEFGVSRTAIWKIVRRALKEGFNIQSVRGHGYQLASPVDFLDQEIIVKNVESASSRPLTLSVIDEIDSTNAEVMRMLARGERATPVVTAETQTAGRGRRGQPWCSPAGENIYLSMGLSLSGGFSAVDGLSLVLGVAVAEALECLGAAPVGLKWPNDIFIDGAKVGGILVELQGELQDGVVHAIVGLGLNVHMTAAPAIDQAWTSLALARPQLTWSRNALVSTLITSIADASDKFQSVGFAGFRSSWQSRDVFFSRQIMARDGELQGVGQGIDHSGNYVLRTNEGEFAVRSGEISLRVAS
ncbi:biotin--[acetyl-CoA-carboxylase] ligase [Marinobacter gelidimuriae]|uniref:biotin--[acetyl-CoA-carboxylase] ligase n=1 Tax=Marinobacter gelidimuriae TaxID=2739064 RepID=UPI000364AD2B|nr:biotin--[acetyl-CoA-carboxylase] ligase [Marinobacter gelidimuriae]